VIEIEPLDEDAKEDLVIENKVIGGSIPKEYIKSVQDGIREAAQSGIMAGYPAVGIKVSILEGSYHEVDSSDLAFKIAGSMAMKDAFMKAKPILLEPYMKVEVVVPEEYAGDVMGYLSSRRANIAGLDTRGDGVSAIHAHAPLGNMFGYATNLRNMSQGRGSFTMEFDRYEPVPESIADDIVKGGL